MTDEALPLVYPISEVSNEPSRPLLLGYLEPEDHTILFGDGSVGKGVISAWWISLLVKDGMKVGIIDYEGHARFEWKPRLRCFGIDVDDTNDSRVFIAQPMKPIWEEVEALRTEFLAHGVEYLVVDSVTYACKGLEVERSTTATLYSAAINELGFPVLSLAHVTKSDPAPKHPFGSVFWSNGARLTINAMKTDDLREVRLRSKKVNGRPHIEPTAVDWTWTDRLGPSEVPSQLVFRAEGGSLSGRIAVALATRPMTIAELVKEVGEDGAGDVGIDAVTKALKRGDEFTSDGKKPATWSVFSPTINRVQIGTQP